MASCLLTTAILPLTFSITEGEGLLEILVWVRGLSWVSRFQLHLHGLNIGTAMINIWLAFDGPGPKIIKLFSYSTQLSTKFILLVNVKMPTIVGILTFMSMINTTSERLKARTSSVVGILDFYEQLKFRTQLSWAWKSFKALGSDFNFWFRSGLKQFISMKSHKRVSWF